MYLYIIVSWIVFEYIIKIMYSNYINVKRRLDMKVLLLNGSPNVNGNTARALEEMRTGLEVMIDGNSNEE